jgi:hypothetical protein
LELIVRSRGTKREEFGTLLKCFGTDREEQGTEREEFGTLLK